MIQTQLLQYSANVFCFCFYIRLELSRDVAAAIDEIQTTLLNSLKHTNVVVFLHLYFKYRTANNIKLQAPQGSCNQLLTDC